MSPVVIGIIVAYVVTYPVFAWTYTELRRYPRHMWTGFGRPYPWRQATIIGYALGGLPVILVALAWRASPTRAGLRELADRARASSDDPAGS